MSSKEQPCATSPAQRHSQAGDLCCPELPETEGSYVPAWEMLEDKNASQGIHWPGSKEFWMYTRFLGACDFSQYLGLTFMAAAYVMLPLVVILCPPLCLTL